MPDSLAKGPDTLANRLSIGAGSEVPEFWRGWPASIEVGAGGPEQWTGSRAVLPTDRPEFHRRLNAALEEVVRGYGSFTREHRIIRIRSATAQEFMTSFKADYRRALDRLLFKVSLGEVGKYEAIELL